VVDGFVFSVPKGPRSLGSYVQAAHRHGVTLHRAIETVTRAKPLFIKSGIPGTVGSATCALWRELAPLLVNSRTFRVWPFDGDLEELLKSTKMVIAEVYPEKRKRQFREEFPEFFR
jgi:hypothetical protein